MFDFRHNHILQSLIVVGIVWLAVLLKSVIIVLFIAFLFTVVFRPLVTWLERHHVPTPLAVVLPIIGLIGILVLIGFYIIPTFVDQARQFINDLPHYLDKIRHSQILRTVDINPHSIQDSLRQHFDSVSNTLLSVTSTVVTILAGLITIIVIMLYWLATYGRSKNTLLTYVPQRHRRRVDDIWQRIEKKLVSWAKAQALLSLVVGALVWIGAAIIGLPFAAALGIISGLLESIPTIGPIAAAVPGILLGLTIDLKTGIAATILYILVQQVENHLIVPLLFGRTVRLHPIVVILSLLSGAVLFGILGALLSLPAALCISAVVDSFRDDPKLQTTKAGKLLK